MTDGADGAQDARAEELSRKAKTVSNEADIAQARKEELWAAAKGAGEGADKTSDRGYVKATEAVGAPPPPPCSTQQPVAWPLKLDRIYSNYL